MPIPLPVLPGVYRCALTWRESGGGQTAVNVIHIYTGGAGDAPATAMDALDDCVTPLMWGDVVTSAQVVDVAITPLNGTAATQHFTPATPTNWSGGIGGQFIPSTAIIVKFGSALRGRANRGRLFLPFIAEGAVANGFESAGNTGIIAVAWINFQAALLALPDGAFEQVIASYDRLHHGAGAHSSLITNYSCEVAVATQRRRQGRNR